MKSLSVTTQMKAKEAKEHSFPVVLFVFSLLCKMKLGNILKRLFWVLLSVKGLSYK